MIMNKDININECKCKKRIVIGFIIRVILTFISFVLVSKYINSKYLLLILPIILTILDGSDNISFIYYLKKIGYTIDECTHCFTYQLMDKINDVFSYLIVYLWFNLDNYFLGFLIWRIIGVIIFGITKSSLPLIVMFDFMKEYLLYKYFFANNQTFLPIAIIAKIIFEYHFHTKVNKRHY